MTQVKSLFYNYTIAALEDKLVEILSYTNTHTIDKQTHEIRFRRKYIEQAEKLLHRINIFQPIPEFVIYLEDIPNGLIHEIEHQGEKAMDKIVTNVVRRLYESVDPQYFHTNGIYGKVRWIAVTANEEKHNDGC